MAKKKAVNTATRYVFGRPTKYSEDVPDKVNEYFEKCLVEDRLPTLEGFAVYLNVGLTTLRDWRDKYDDFSRVYEFILNAQADLLLSGGVKGIYNASVTNRILGANHGYVDRKDVTSAGKEMKSFNFQINEPSDGHKLDSDQAAS